MGCPCPGIVVLPLLKALLRQFESFLKDGDLEQCERFAGHAFELARENTSHCVAQRQWVEKLIERSNFVRADEVTLRYLEYLREDDTTHRFIKNRITWWADPLRRNGAELPKSSAYFRANFPEVNLDGRRRESARTFFGCLSGDAIHCVRLQPYAVFGSKAGDGSPFA
jgi:hypothetical protein